MDAIMQALAPRCSPQIKARHGMQTYTCMHEYFTEAEWKILREPKVTMSHQRDVIFARAAKLGLRSPSEPTVKWLTSLLLVLCETPESLNGMVSALKHDMLNNFKVLFKSYFRRAMEPCVP